jgi:RNA polymerase sigma-B factor
MRLSSAWSAPADGGLRDHNAGEDCARREQTQWIIEQLQQVLAAGGPPGRERQLRQDLAAVNSDLAARVAARYRGRGEALEDLVQAARLGLVKAANGFSPGKGAAFLPYALPTIFGEIKRHFRDHAWDVRPPRRIQDLTRCVQDAADELSQRNGQCPTPSMIAQYLQVSQDDVNEALASTHVFHVQSLDAPLAGYASLADTLGAEDQRLELLEDLLSLRPHLDQLPAVERRVISLCFFAEQTQQQIADQIGVSQMQVSRLITRALYRLRQTLLQDQQAS